MNCEGFESVVLDFARVGPDNSEVRESALAHAAGCARCSARLSQERSLTGGLAALAAQDALRRAPQRLETVLLSEFRGQCLSARPAAPASRSSGGWPQRNRRRNLALTAGLATAATWLLAVAASRHSREKPPAPVSARPAVSVTAVAVTAHPQPGQQKDAFAENLKRLRPSEPGNKHSQVATVRWRAGATPHEAPVRMSPNAEGENFSGFLPLPYGSGLSLADGGAMLRVALPPSGLASLGLPVQPDAGSVGFVQADVIIGEDGLARGIRFVK